MKKIEYADPTELGKIPGVTVKVSPLPKETKEGVSPLACEIWAFSKRKITSKGGRVILRGSETITNSFARKIEEFLSDVEHLEAHFCGKRPTDSEIASRAGFSRAKWNRLTSATHLDIERGNAFAVAVALCLDENQTAELLYAGGFVLNYELELDCAMMYFIKNGIYDLRVITDALSEFCDIRNGLDKFTFSPRNN